MTTEQGRSRLWRWRYLLILIGLTAGVGASTIAFAGLPAGGMPPKPAARHQAQPPGNLTPSSGPRSSISVPLGPSDPIPPPVLRGKPGAQGSHNSPNDILYDQYDYLALSATSSQNFEPAYDQYDSQGADDFAVPVGQTWLVNEVDVAGAYAGYGRADSVNVIFYASAGDLPGGPVYTATNIVPASGLDTGDFSILLDQPATFTAGTYWVSVQANERLNPNGQWFWRNRINTAYNGAAWRNPGGGFFTPCPSWGRRSFGCGLAWSEPDQVYRLIGTPPPPATGTPTETATGTPPTATDTPTGTPPTETSTATDTGTPTATNTEAATVPIPVPTGIATVIRDTATPQPSCGPYWRVVNSPNPGQNSDYLGDVATISATDIWAVGSYRDTSGILQPTTLHWDGISWNVVDVPVPLYLGNLAGVAAISSDNVWAVGYASADGISNFGLILHWDGNSWADMTPNSIPPDSQFNDVAVLAPDDAWAAGSYYDEYGNAQTLTAHWTGSAWSIVSSPNFGTADWLNSVSGSEPNDVWAVGTYTSAGPFQTLTMHWDGGQWSIVNNIFTGDDAQLYSVSVLAPNDVWAVGYFFYDFYDYSTLTIHWDGNSWSFIASPQPDIDSRFSGVLMIAPDDVWAVGSSYYYDGMEYTQRTFTARWDGTQWTQVAAPDPPGSSLQSVGAVSSDNLWDVGSFSPGYTLVEHYNDPCATPSPTVTGTPPTATATRTRIPSPTATNSPTHTNTPTSTDTPTPTNTPTNMPSATAPATYTPTSTPTSLPSTNTPTNTPVPTGTHTPASTVTPTWTSTPTPTICTLSFTDVPPGSTFYQWIHCLACLGIVNGYPDGSFKPNNNVTRGQLSKIVSNSAGFSDSQTAQMFQDVPPGSTFFQYIGRLASRGYISGYTCGGTGEPCRPGNLPYFRPNNNATRGQISKIVSNAAGFNETPHGQQFQDVGIGSTYYPFTYRLVTRNIMQGYSCGGASEPCIPPANLPYFRPNNNATRGQTSKIDGGAFFPDCSSPNK